MIPTSPLVHVLGPILAWLAARRLGWPNGAWYKAALGTLLLALATRALAPAAGNVNLAFEVWRGYEGFFPRHEPFALAVALGATALYFAADVLYARCFRSQTQNRPIT
jgi:hypothetical protein